MCLPRINRFVGGGCLVPVLNFFAVKFFGHVRSRIYSKPRWLLIIPAAFPNLWDKSGACTAACSPAASHSCELQRHQRHGILLWPAHNSRGCGQRSCFTGQTYSSIIHSHIDHLCCLNTPWSEKRFCPDFMSMLFVVLL